MMPRGRSGARIPLRERADLARQAHAMHERGAMIWEIALHLGLTRTTARNLVGFGARLAAGQGEPLSWLLRSSQTSND